MHPSPQIAAPRSSSQEQSSTPSASMMHVSNKRPINSPVDKSLSKYAKRAKNNDYNCAEEVSTEMTVGFDLEKYWYESTPFPQLHAILQHQYWETLRIEYCYNPIYPNLMREFTLNFSIDNGVCSSMVKDIKIEFNSLMLGEWFGVPTTGFDTYPC